MIFFLSINSGKFKTYKTYKYKSETSAKVKLSLCMCSAPCWNWDNSGIVLRKVGIPTLFTDSAIVLDNMHGHFLNCLLSVTTTSPRYLGGRTKLRPCQIISKNLYMSIVETLGLTGTTIILD